MLTGTFAVTCPALASEVRASERLKVSQTVPEEASDPLRLWFAEQDRLLDDILVRLSRIENLVREIHQLIMQMPSGAATSGMAKVAPADPVTAPPPKPAATGILGFFDQWVSILAGIGLLLPGWMILQRHRKNRRKPAQQAASTTSPKTSLEEPKFLGRQNLRASSTSIPEISLGEPAFLLELEVADTPAPKVAAPPATSSTSRIQLGDAMEPSKGRADQALELADIMLSMGLGHGAAQTLTDQIRNEPKQALLHWLKLLEIYRNNGQQAEFEKSAEELRQHFNVQPEDWQVRPEAVRSIEDYPHITTRMCELWERSACLVYLQNLLADNRGGARSGFPQSVAEELLLLTAMLKARAIATEADTAIGS